MPKGNKHMPPGPGRPKGLKNKATIAREERRAIFDAEVSKMFLDKIKKAKPEYLLDQFLGKAGEKLEINANIKKELDPKVKEELQTILNGVIEEHYSRKPD